MNHRITPRMTALAALSTTLLLAACGGDNDGDGQVAVDARSKLAVGTCAVTIADPSAICGTLTVPEERSNQASRLIGLPFVILPAKAVAPAKDPVVIYTGGPGPSPLQTLAAIPAEALQQFPLRQKRDMIVMTHRGTDLTTPSSLDCKELVLDFAGGERFASEEAVVKAAQTCRDRLVAEGAKLSNYTTKTIARDMEDLRVLLGKQRGFDAWNVVGSSYGSRLALVTMRDAPKGVRSVVLDGPFPLQERPLDGAEVLDGLSQVLAACNAQTDCAAAYPTLQARFAVAVEKLETTPAVVNGATVRGHDVLNALRGALPVPEPAYGSVPLFMQRVAQGDLAGADAVLPFLANLILAINPEGMFYTVTCTDDAGLTTAASNELPAAGAGWPDAVRRLVAKNNLRLQARTCPLWTQGASLSANELKPVRSDLPTLITVGQFDVATPVSSADLLLPDLSRARKVVFTGRGHALLESDACMLTVAAAFIDDPKAALDTSCIDAADTLRFVTPTSAQAQKVALQDALQQLLRAQPLMPSVIAQVESPSTSLSWSGAAGVIDRVSQKPAAAETVFRIASINKTFTAAAVYLLAEQGVMKLEDSIATHLLPETTALLRERGYEPDRITVLQMLAHTSGIPTHDQPPYYAAVLADPSRRWTRREQLLFALDRFPKAGAPGETFSYSDTAYTLLGEIIERKTGKSLGEALRSLLKFEQLGLRSTWMETSETAPSLPAGFAHAYTDTGIDTRGIDASIDTYGGGGLVSTVGDLTRFYRALFEGRVVAPSSLASMQTLLVGVDSPIGLGRGVFRFSLGQQSCWGHEGFWGGGVYHCPDARISVSLTNNLAVIDEANSTNLALLPSTLAAQLLDLASK